MATTTNPLPPVAERITGATTLGRMVLSASERGEDVALRYPVGEGLRSISYSQFGEHSRAIALGVIALGMEPGDVVAILCSTRAEWTLCEAGAVCAGTVVAPIYHTNSPEECLHVLSHSEARLVFCEDAAQVAKIEQIRARCPALGHVIVIAGEAPGATPLEELRSQGEGVDVEEVERRVRAVEPDDVATLVYTSGTTGPPKGCMLTHANFLSATAMYRGQLELDDIQPVIYMFLPLAHVLARVAQTAVIDVGGTLVYWRGDPKRILEEVVESEPTHFVAVPRIYEKMHTGDHQRGREPWTARASALCLGAARSDAARASPSVPGDAAAPSPPRGCAWPTASASPRCARCSAPASSSRSSAPRRSTMSCSSSSTPAGCSCSRATG